MEAEPAVRIATSRDVDRLRLDRDDRAGFVLVAGDPPLGSVHVLDLAGHAHLHHVSVHPDHLRRGTGRALVAAALVEAGRRGHGELTLSVGADPSWVAGFCRQLGFHDIDEADLPPAVRAWLTEGPGSRVVMRVPLATQIVQARPAVSVIPVRDGPEGLELFVQHRQTTMDFAAGAVVFPGGRCDPDDVAIGADLPLPPDVLEDHVRRWAQVDPEGTDPRQRARTLLATGLRELDEETGMVARASDLLPWDRWVTPEIVPIRFDVAFYVLPVPHGAASQPRHRTTEAVRSGWEPAARLLADLAAGRLTMLTPTRVLVGELLALGDVGTVRARRPVITGVRDDRTDGRPRPGQDRW